MNAFKAICVILMVEIIGCFESKIPDRQFEIICGYEDG